VSEERQITGTPADLPPGTDTGDWEIDPVSGLLRERHLPVLLQQVVAAARRKVLPVSVVFWELDGLGAAPTETCEQALTALGAVAWRTLRESDAVFRLGDVVAVAVLVDTAEPGAIMVADRVRDALRASPVGDSLTVSAGIACYPSHALDAAEVVARAGKALETARASGYERDHVAVASHD
jgi:diguanylate cyclase (GGDEF)-like protein